MKRRALFAAMAVLAAWSLPAAFAEWPEKPVKLVVPYPPGGIADALGRHVARILERDLGQPVVIENRGGAGSNIGSDLVAKSAPDGYTLLLGSSANSVNMSLYRKVPYDTQRDFIPVSLLADVPNVLVVTASFPARSIEELVAMARQKPDELAYASAGSGSPAHLAAEQFTRLAGVKIRHVPYKGAGPAITDVIAGHIPMMFTNIAAVQGGVEAGRLRILATGSRARWPTYPNVPTIAESGLAGYEAGAWYGLLVPAGTPAPVVARLEHALAGVRAPESLEAIRKLGADPVVSSPEVLKARIAAEVRDYAKLIKEVGLVAD
jgi:tripartite-type tricarboxylate transporter receptor subunit TctC